MGKRSDGRISMPVLLTSREREIVRVISQRSQLRPGDLLASIVRRYLKNRYQPSRKEWYQIFRK